MTANPIELISGLAGGGNVSKADIISWAKNRVAQILADAAEVNGTDLSDQQLIQLKSTGASYELDTSDTTGIDNGDTILVDSAGNRFHKIPTGDAATAAKLATARNIDGQAFDGSADITVIAPGTHAATSKATPVDADELPLADSEALFALKKLTWANLKSTVATYFASLAQTLTNKTIDTASNTFKLNGTSFGTATQATAALNAMVGDSGSGGTKGMVPAPAAGDAAAGKFLKADGTFAVPAGSGSATDGVPKAVISLTNPGNANPTITTLFSGIGTITAVRNSAGNYTISWTTALTNLMVGAMGIWAGSGAEPYLSYVSSTSTSVTLRVENSQGVNNDQSFFAQIYGTI